MAAIASATVCASGNPIHESASRSTPERIQVPQAHGLPLVIDALAVEELPDKIIRRPKQELGGGADLLDPSRGHQGNPVAELESLGDIMRDQDDRLAAQQPESVDLAADLHPADRVERTEGFIHQDHRRIRNEGPGQATRWR